MRVDDLLTIEGERKIYVLTMPGGLKREFSRLSTARGEITRSLKWMARRGITREDFKITEVTVRVESIKECSNG